MHALVSTHVGTQCVLSPRAVLLLAVLPDYSGNITDFASDHVAFDTVSSPSSWGGSSVHNRAQVDGGQKKFSLGYCFVFLQSWKPQQTWGLGRSGGLSE